MTSFVIIAIFAGIVASLGSAMYYLVRDGGRSPNTVRALTLRIGLSVGLFALLFVAWALGLIEPHGLMPPG